jgi:S-adenosylmethionine/arginine decarboxylase-like enzyme
MKPLKHEHLLISARVNRPLVGGQEEDLKNWIISLVDLIDMKILAGPIVAYVDKVGNRGLTSVSIIETSHIAIHIWDEPEPALIQLDVYSCDELDPALVVEHLALFDIVDIEFKFLDRENGFVEKKLK